VLTTHKIPILLAMAYDTFGQPVHKYVAGLIMGFEHPLESRSRECLFLGGRHVRPHDQWSSLTQSFCAGERAAMDVRAAWASGVERQLSVSPTPNLPSRKIFLTCRLFFSH
jgi:hypothetical protein